MDDVQSRWSNMVWKRFQTYFSVRAIHLNSMFSNFCHVLKFQQGQSFNPDEEEFIRRMKKKKKRGQRPKH